MSHIKYMETKSLSKYYIAAGVLIIAILVGNGLRSKTWSVIGKSQAFVLPVPFSPQAPTNNWGRNEDCEETSITMANAYLTGTTQNELPAAAAQESINTLKGWEEKNIGYNADTGVDATMAMAEGAFGLKVKKIPYYTAEDLKNELRAKHPILLPIDARLLNNPKYQNSGPQYHMIVVRGFEGNAFIVNDPGTNDGNSNKYTFDVLKKAAANWNQTTKSMEPNTKVALVLYK